ncbi:MAG TPA: polymer-forming cytoskeletal protein [Brumimicrobium sp.]|nr:polymer-forming cytoskeletal protein [Brumimicrobium sp.]
MFKGEKNKVKDSPDRLNRLVSGTKLTGDLTTNSSLRIDGQVDGSIVCNGKLVLGQDGVITGDINATEVELDGTVEGHINAEVLLTLHQTAIVKGDIRTGRLVIEDGAHIEGNIHTGDLPKVSKPSLQVKEKHSKDQSKASDIVY